LGRLRRLGTIGGLFCDGEVVYLARERYAGKHDINSEPKKTIGREAAKIVKDGQVIAIDSGSTTLEIARILGERLRARSIYNLHIFTNSVIIAFEMCNVLSELEADDLDQVCKISLLGGWCRPTSMSTIPTIGARARAIESHLAFAHLPTKFDLAFVGTNGLYRSEGFGMTHEFEVPAKREFVTRSNRAVMVADASKFKINQDLPFA
jgi:DeoR/GlpR family transcriptional regulator of sugar metabolism